MRLFSLPRDEVADFYFTAGKNLGERASTPTWTHRILKSRQIFLHPFARRRFASDRETHIANRKHASSSVRERNPLEKNVRATTRWIRVSPKLGHHPVPNLSLDQRDLSSATPIDASLETFTFDDIRSLHGIHRSAMSALQPDCLDDARPGVIGRVYIHGSSAVGP